MSLHRWAVSPHGMWVCACGEARSMVMNPNPDRAGCTYSWHDNYPLQCFPASIVRLSNLWSRGEFAYILASGASMDGFKHREMFRGLNTIAVNEVHRDFPCRFVLAHHGECCQEAIDNGLSVVTSEYHCGISAWGKNLFRGHYYTYKHKENQGVTDIDLSVIDSPDHLLMSACTVVEAIHLAYYLGSRTIFLCGVDGGTIDGKINYTGYNGGGATQLEHIRHTRPILDKVVAEFRRRGVAIYSLNPWIDPSLEGHIYERPAWTNRLTVR